MAESEPNSHLAAPGEGDVERLLREAESLTQEVARETGAPVRDADALLSGELSGAPDPLAAVEAASSSIMSLEDLLGEMGPADARGDQQAAPRSPASADPPASARRSTPSNPPVARTADRPLKSQSVEMQAASHGPRVEHSPLEEEAGTPSNEHPADDPNPPQEQTKKAKPPKGPRVPIGRRMLQLGKSGVRGLLTAVLIIVRDVPIGLLSFVDLPFRRTPRSIKNAIGIIGAITLGMGALAWALPDLMKPSPPPPPGSESHESAPAAHESGHSGGH